MLLSLILGIMIGGVAVIFALQNTFAVTLTFFVWEITTSVAIIIYLALLVGLLIGALFAIPSTIENFFTILKLKKANKKFSDEIKTAQKANQQTADSSSTEVPSL